MWVPGAQTRGKFGGFDNLWHFESSVKRKMMKLPYFDRMLWKLNRKTKRIKKRGFKERLPSNMVSLIYFDTVHTVPMSPQEERPFPSIFKCLRWLNFRQPSFPAHITNYKRATAAKRPISQRNVQEVCLFEFGSAANINPSTNHSHTSWHMLTGPFQQSAMFLEQSLHPLYSSSSHLPHCISPATLVLEAVDSMMKCTYWETLVPIFTSLYLSCLECQFC